MSVGITLFEKKILPFRRVDATNEHGFATK